MKNNFVLMWQRRSARNQILAIPVSINEEKVLNLANLSISFPLVAALLTVIFRGSAAIVKIAIINS